jgi:hypothetical protein
MKLRSMFFTAKTKVCKILIDFQPVTTEIHELKITLKLQKAAKFG